MAIQTLYHSPMLDKKPHRSIPELVNIMENKGITFHTISKDNAVTYLTEKNNFLRLYAYRKNFQKASLGAKKGQYLHLDFSHLRAMAIFDLHLRKQIFEICIDIEHYLKLLILKDFEKRNHEDAYFIVTAFFKSNSYTANEIIQKCIQRNGYVSDLLHKYISECEDKNEDDGMYYHSCNWDHETKLYRIDMPIWVLLESLTLGALIRFYTFYYQFYEAEEPIEKGLLNSIKSIRNACAHNNCILHNLSSKQCKPISSVRTFVMKKGCTKSMANSRLTCRTLHECACVLCLANKRIGSDSFLPENVLLHDLKGMQDVMIRFEEKYLYLFQKNDQILSSFQFLKKLIEMIDI